MACRLTAKRMWKRSAANAWRLGCWCKKIERASADSQDSGRKLADYHVDEDGPALPHLDRSLTQVDNSREYTPRELLTRAIRFRLRSDNEACLDCPLTLS